MLLHRRSLLMGGAGLVALLAAPRIGEAKDMTTDTIDFRNLSDADWRKRLSPQAYDGMRKHGTERAGTSPLDHEKRKGTFACAGCGQPFFSSDTKFERGTVWPSFYEPLPHAVETKSDR